MTGSRRTSPSLRSCSTALPVELLTRIRLGAVLGGFDNDRPKV
jgi:hypothetical protein